MKWFHEKFSKLYYSESSGRCVKELGKKVVEMFPHLEQTPFYLSDIRDPFPLEEAELGEDEGDDDDQQEPGHYGRHHDPHRYTLRSNKAFLT